MVRILRVLRVFPGTTLPDRASSVASRVAQLLVLLIQVARTIYVRLVAERTGVLTVTCKLVPTEQVVTCVPEVRSGYVEA